MRIRNCILWGSGSEVLILYIISSYLWGSGVEFLGLGVDIYEDPEPIDWIRDVYYYILIMINSSIYRFKEPNYRIWIRIIILLIIYFVLSARIRSWIIILLIIIIFIILARLCWAAASPRFPPTTATRCVIIKIRWIFCLLFRPGNILYPVRKYLDPVWISL